MASMVGLGTYEFKYYKTGKTTPEESFMNAYAEELYESEQVRTSTKQLIVILVATYENTGLNKVTEEKFQHLT